MCTAFRHKFLSWARQNHATSSHPTSLSSTLTSPSVPRSSTWAFSFRFFAYVPHVPTTSPFVIWLPEHELWHSSLHKSFTLSHVFPSAPCRQTHSTLVLSTPQTHVQTRVSQNSTARPPTTRRSGRSPEMVSYWQRMNMYTRTADKGYSPSNNTFSE
jgi:hypothetical protein